MAVDGGELPFSDAAVDLDLRRLLVVLLQHVVRKLSLVHLVTML